MSSKEKQKAHVNIELKDLIPIFFENTWEDVRSLQDAMEKEDYREIKRLGHSIKGASAGYGFRDLSRKGLVIENAAANFEDMVEISRLVQDLVSYIENVDVVYVSYDSP